MSWLTIGLIVLGVVSLGAAGVAWLLAEAGKAMDDDSEATNPFQ